MMTSISAPSEAKARALAEAIGASPLLEALPVDVNETAPGRWSVSVYFESRPAAALLAALAKATGGRLKVVTLPETDWVAKSLAGLAPAAALLAALAKATGGRLKVVTLPETDWVAKSLAGLAPVRAGRFLIHGQHDRGRVRANDIGIEIEAGQAFGTGHHGTTTGCLLAIARVAGRRSVRNALDLGTGSGVLAIALARRARCGVVATDIDPVAVKVAAENVRLNGVGRRVRAVTAAGFAHPAIRTGAPYDLIVANILAGPLVALAPAIARHLAPRGTVILSGLLASQRRQVGAAYRSVGLRRGREIVIDGWATLVFESPKRR